MANFIQKRSNTTLFIVASVLTLGIMLLTGTPILSALLISIAVGTLFTLGIAGTRPRYKYKGPSPIEANTPSTQEANASSNGPSPALSATYDILCAIDPPKPDPIAQMTANLNTQAQAACDRAAVRATAQGQPQKDSKEKSEESIENEIARKMNMETAYKEAKQKMEEDHQKQLLTFKGSPEEREAFIQKQNHALSNLEEKYKVTQDYIASTTKKYNS